MITRLTSLLLLAGISALLAPALGNAPAPAAALAAPSVPTHVRPGRSGAHEAVIGGAPAQPGAFASVVDVIDLHGRQGAQCSGTVVAPTLILTAGHCAENMRTGVAERATGFRVLISSSGAAGAEGQILGVSGVIVYERFARRNDSGDAALLVLSAPTSAPPVALATSSDSGAVQPGSLATIVGWGDTHFQQRRPTEDPRVADTVVQGSGWCARKAPPFFGRSEICTIDPPRYATGACHGDSGGPLLAPAGPGGELVEIGIAIHGYGRCSTRLPSVFTRASAIASWVQTWIDAYRPPPIAPAPAVPAP